MKKVETKGNCLECDRETYIQLDCGKYACEDCITRIGFETQFIREMLESYDDNITHIFECLLLGCKTANITSVDNILKTLEAIKLYKKYTNDNLDEETVKKIEKQLDIYIVICYNLIKI